MRLSYGPLVFPKRINPLTVFPGVSPHIDGARAVTVDDDGRLHLGSLSAIPDPESLVELRTQVESRLPQVDLPEVLLEVAEWTGYPDAFVPVSGGNTRLDGMEISIAALLVAEACNIGLSPVARSGVAALTRDRLSHLGDSWHMICCRG